MIRYRDREYQRRSSSSGLGSKRSAGDAGLGNNAVSVPFAKKPAPSISCGTPPADLSFGEPVEPSTPQALALVEMVREVTGTSSYPGAESLQLSSSRVTSLNNSKSIPLWVSWRPVGRRVLLLVSEGSCFLVSKDSKGLCGFTSVSFHLPHGSATRPNSKTLLDGILVDDKDPSTGLTQKRLLVFDCLSLNGRPVRKEPLHSRLSVLQKVRLPVAM
jgi:hypothetical protein